jgi:hypothetical protein
MQLRTYEVKTLSLTTTSMSKEDSPITLQQQLRELRSELIAKDLAATASSKTSENCPAKSAAAFLPVTK